MNIEYPSGVLIGYELEFCSKRGIAEEHMRPLADWFCLGRDSSLNPRSLRSHMYEIRSRNPMNVVSIDVIKLMLDHLDLVVTGPHRMQEQEFRDRLEAIRNAWIPDMEVTRKPIFTTRNCGLHVHISWADRRLAHILFGRLAEVLPRKVVPFEERRNYCSPEFNSSRGPRYNALRWVSIDDGHFEARIFNGTMKLRGIVHALRTIRNEALLVARASQAAKTTQSANCQVVC